MDEAVSLRGVTKMFGPTAALAGLTMSVCAGEVHAFLGPNGAGKTTTLRLLLGLLRADRGEIEVLGLDPWADAVALHRRVAYVPGDVSLWPGLTGGETIDLLCGLRGGVDPRRRDELIDLFELDPRRRGRSYSKGNRQKVALITALAVEADLYLLDEPTSGLDPIMEARFRTEVAHLRAQGRTVLLSSHILSEAEALCDRVSIIREGVLVASGTLADLRELTTTSITARTRTDAGHLHVQPGVHGLTVESGVLHAQVEAAALPAFMAALSACGIEDLTSHPPTLEDLFLEHYAGT